jgi:hypothetical protein
MPRQVRDGVILPDVPTKFSQAPVLCVFKSIPLKTFKLNADRIVVAIGSPAVLGLPRMPGAVIAADKLPQGTVAAYVKVR